MKYILLILLVFFIVGCSPPPEEKKESEGVRLAKSLYRDAFFEKCMKLAPAGPQQTKYNDWAELVEECSSVSYYHMNQRFAE